MENANKGIYKFVVVDNGKEQAGFARFIDAIKYRARYCENAKILKYTWVFDSNVNENGGYYLAKVNYC